MKKILCIFLFIIAANILFAKSNSKNEKQIFTFDSVDLDGNKISSELYSSNKITMINIWGTFCGPCIREMPELAELSKEYKAKGLEIIGIPIDLTDNRGQIIENIKADADYIIKGTGVTYRNIVPTPQMLSGFLRGIMAVPTTIFVDRDGNQLGELYMGARSKKDWQKIIDKLLESQK
ncbi:MAG: TlpA family protein disulfide reductase [Treponema sp.]|nr:TlpA family protein disulfide reductase [Treponema sp.]